MDKCGREERASDNNIIGRMRFASQIAKARILTHTQKKKILIAFPGATMNTGTCLIVRFVRNMPVLCFLAWHYQTIKPLLSRE